MQWQSLEETPSGDGVYGFEPLQPKTHPGAAMKVSQVWDVSPRLSGNSELKISPGTLPPDAPKLIRKKSKVPPRKDPH
jgi:hypothetical protein